ncbi:hypothetical protein FO519_006089 [Halicephalobus sp. NKZ332]|nr:hypothetical protein FO519_006089 [Halicephalobus sp. NKZ332]
MLRQAILGGLRAARVVGSLDFAVAHSSTFSRFGGILAVKSELPVLHQSRFYSAKQPLSIKTVEERIKLVLSLYDKIDASKLTMDSDFFKDLGLDSLDFVEVVMALEDEFGFEIPDGDSDRFKTPRDIFRYMTEKPDSGTSESLSKKSGSDSLDLLFKKPFPFLGHKLPWNNWIDEERFCIVCPHIIKELQIRCYGTQVMSSKDVYIGSKLVARRDQLICYLHPYELLFLVAEYDFIWITEDSVTESILIPFDIATRLTDFKTFSPEIYVRYRDFRRDFVCRIQTTFTGAAFSIYPDTPDVSHSMTLVYPKQNLNSLRAAARVCETIRKYCRVIDGEEPSINTKDPDWLYLCYKFSDLEFLFFPGSYQSLSERKTSSILRGLVTV